MSTMFYAMIASKSVVLKKFGDCDAVEIAQFPLPPLEGRVEIEVYYCGMNFSDLYTRLGLFKKQLPVVLGTECCGIIRSIGTQTDLKIGQRVICYDHAGGLYSETIRVHPFQVFPIPDDIPFDVGASIFVNYLTAYFSLYALGNLKPNETVLINSCAGGVGWAATELAKNVENVKIYGTASKGKEKYVKENGVTKVFDYDNLNTDLIKVEPNGVDVIIENQAGRTLYDNIALLKPLGRMVLTGMNMAIANNKFSYYALFKMWWKSWWFSVSDLVYHNRCVTGLHLGTLMMNDRTKVEDALNYIIKLFKEKKITPKIDSVWPLEQYHDAVKILADRKNVGKILLKVKSDDDK